MKIVYRKVGRRAVDIRVAPEDYVATAEEFMIEADEFPDAESLSDPTPLDEIKSAAAARIDAAAGRARGRYITVAPGQDATYLAKALEADDYVALGRPSNETQFPILRAEAEARGITVSELADLVRATRDQWIQLAAAIEAIRIGGKLAVDAAVDADGVEAAAAQAEASLNLV